MRTTRVTTTGAALAAPIAVAVLAGCGSAVNVGSAAGGGGGTVTSSTATSGAVSAGVPGGVPGGASSGAAASSAEGAAGAVGAVGAAAAAGEVQATGSGVPRCHTADLALRVYQGPQDGGAIGSFYVELTNGSTHTCTLYGFPGVDLLNAGGASLGMKDIWSVGLAPSGAKQLRTLTPGQSSSAYVTFVTTPAGESGTHPSAATVSVIPPDETTALHAAIDNVETGAVRPTVASGTLTVGPMDVDDVPHR